MLNDSLNNQCFGVECPNSGIFLDMDCKLEQWEDHLPLEYQIDYDVALLHDYTSADLVILDRQRYTIHTWYFMSRLKLLVASSTGHCRPPQAPLHKRQSLERCISLSTRTIRFQTARYNAVTGDLHASIHPGVAWGFEGCFSLFEASVALRTTLAQYSWREKLMEADMLIQSALLTFNDWRLREPGKTSEIAARAIEVLITIQEQRWSETKGSQPSETKDDPETLKAPKFMLSLLSDVSKDLNGNYPHTQYSMSNVRDDGTRDSHARVENTRMVS
ncbi:hypothetical protein BYT27DRAFT_6353974 [Phlegmacium glaucopus]|nr:hypothetical protein BYT27DRAFT_6353974 [Phlegmacium glaucopus]